MAHDDVSWMAEACQDPEIPRWTFMPSPYTEHDARALVAAAAEALASGQRAELAAVDAHGGKRLGAIGELVRVPIAVSRCRRPRVPRSRR